MTTQVTQPEVRDPLLQEVLDLMNDPGVIEHVNSRLSNTGKSFDDISKVGLVQIKQNAQQLLQYLCDSEK